jgi:hypothetical protein
MRPAELQAKLLWCQQAGHPNNYMRRRVAANGAIHIEVWCPGCSSNVTRACTQFAKTFLSAEDCGHLGVEPDDLPIEYLSGRRVSLCHMCRAWGEVEMHHILPRAIFPADLSESAGEIPLCPDCHSDVTEVWERWRKGRAA